MKITIIALQSLDGFIAKNQDDNLSWGTKADKDFFRSKTKEIGTMIMGANTFRAMPKKAFSDRYTLVLTSDTSKFKEYTNEYGDVEFFSGTPEEVVFHLSAKGIGHAVLAGGGYTYGSFLSASLVDEMYITIAPHIFSSGIASFKNLKLDIKLNLISKSELGKDEILLHYEVNTK